MTRYHIEHGGSKFGDFESYQEVEKWLKDNGWESEGGNSWYIRFPSASRQLFVEIQSRFVVQTKPLEELMLRTKR